MAWQWHVCCPTYAAVGISISLARSTYLHRRRTYCTFKTPAAFSVFARDPSIEYCTDVVLLATVRQRISAELYKSGELRGTRPSLVLALSRSQFNSSLLSAVHSSMWLTQYVVVLLWYCKRPSGKLTRRSIDRSILQTEQTPPHPAQPTMPAAMATSKFVQSRHLHSVHNRHHHHLCNVGTPHPVPRPRGGHRQQHLEGADVPLAEALPVATRPVRQLPHGDRAALQAVQDQGHQGANKVLL